jgi:hypothetical protein
MRNNTIYGYMNRLYWNEKKREDEAFGLITYYKSDLPLQI